VSIASVVFFQDGLKNFRYVKNLSATSVTLVRGGQSESITMDIYSVLPDYGLGATSDEMWSSI
jgi:hypothetical protein